MPIEQRMKHRLFAGRIFATVLVVFCCLTAAQAAMRYDITPIWADPTMPNGIFPSAINNNGDVVGDRSTRPFLYTDAGGFQSFPRISEDWATYPLAINDSRQVIAYHSSEVYGYSSENGYSHVAELSNGYGTSSRGPHLNNAGQIALTRDVLTPGGPYLAMPQATLYQPSQGLQGLGFLNGHRTWANGLNDLGWVVGGSVDNNGDVRRAFLWNNGLVELPMREAFDINDSGMIVGQTDSLQPVVWKNGQLIPITVSGVFSGNLAINNQGVVIGSSTPPGEIFSTSFIWTEETGTLYLRNLVDPASGMSSVTVRGINDSGQIACNGTLNGQASAFRLNPLGVPEPGTWALLGIGAVIRFFVSRRRLLKTRYLGDGAMVKR